MRSRYIVWQLTDSDGNLWVSIDCDTFDQAADAWLAGIQSGERMEITERVPVRLTDGRLSSAAIEQVAPKKLRTPQKPRQESMSSRVIEALRNAPDGLSRAQLATRTGLTKTDAAAAAAGLMKRGLVRSEQHPADANRGRPAPGHETVSVYFAGDDNGTPLQS